MYAGCDDIAVGHRLPFGDATVAKFTVDDVHVLSLAQIQGEEKNWDYGEILTASADSFKGAILDAKSTFWDRSRLGLITGEVYRIGVVVLGLSTYKSGMTLYYVVMYQPCWGYKP